MTSPFSFNLGKIKNSAENAARHIANKRIPNLGVKIPGAVFRNIPIIGQSIRDLAVRTAQGEVPKELHFLLGDLLRSGSVNHKEPEKPQGGSQLESFITILRQRNVVRSDRFVVTFTFPPVINGGTDVVQTLALLCDEASIPSKTIHTRQAMFNALPEQRAHMIDFGGESINFRFLLDGNWEAKKFFDDWMNAIVNPTTREVEFYKNYIAEVEIASLDTNHNKTLVTKLENAFPRVAAAIPLSYTNRDVAYLNVTMTYKRWTTEIVNYGHHPSIPNPIKPALRDPTIQNKLNQIKSITSQF